MDEVQVTDVQTTEPAAEPMVQSEEIQAEAPPVVEAPPPVQEKMIPQSQVNKIAAREARQAVEKARAQIYAEMQSQQEPVAEQPSSMGGMPQMSPEQFQKQLMQVAEGMSRKMTADKMAADFEAKINAEIEADPDFADLYDSLNILQNPELVIWMNGMDNSAKVVKELALNPSKFANVLMLAKSGVPQMAQRELNKISESIRTNQAALAEPQVKAPLDQLSPSSVGIGSGEMSVSDFQKQDWLRG
jgi:hypothetical protein